MAQRRVPAGQRRAGARHELGQAAGVAVGRRHARTAGRPGRLRRRRARPPWSRRPRRRRPPPAGPATARSRRPGAARRDAGAAGEPPRHVRRIARLGRRPAPHGGPPGRRSPRFRRPPPARRPAASRTAPATPPAGTLPVTAGPPKPLPGAALGLGQEPVADPADGPPARQLGHERGQCAAGQRLRPGPAGQGQQDFAVVLAADQAGTGREKLDRAAGAVPHPADGQRALAVALGADPGVVGGDQGGKPLRPAGVARLVPGCFRVAGLGPPRYFGDPVRVKLSQFGPA